MQSVPKSEQAYACRQGQQASLCPAGKILEARTTSDLNYIMAMSKDLKRSLEKIEGKLDELNRNSISDFNKIEALSKLLDDLKSWKSSVENFQNLFGQHLSDHEALELAHRRYSQGWGILGGLSGASILEIFLRGLSYLFH